MKVKKAYMLLIFSLIFSFAKAQDTRLFENDWYFNNGSVDSQDFLALPHMQAQLLISIDGIVIMHDYCGEATVGEISLINETSIELFNILNVIKGTCFEGDEKEFMFLHYSFYAAFGGAGDVNNPFDYLIEEVGDDLRLTITNGNGDIAVYNNVLLSTSVFETQDIAIYPNPVTESLFVVTELPITAWRVYNVLGEQVLSGKELETSIPVANLNQGVYFIELQACNNKLIKQFVKQ